MIMSTDHDTDVEREERAIYAIIALAVSPVIIGLLIEGGVVDAGATLSILVVVGALVGLLTTFGLLRRKRTPTVRVHTRH
jgi:hypothetical protein